MSTFPHLSRSKVETSRINQIAPARGGHHARSSRRYLIGFAYAIIGAQIGLVLLGDTAIRLPIRIAAYACSLALLAILPSMGRAHPAARMLPLVALVFGIEFLHPDGDRLLAQLAQMALYLAVLAPLAWVGRLKVDYAAFRKLVLILWIFYLTSAMVGVLQVVYPGRYIGALSANFDKKAIAPHLFKLANGQTIIRPLGLSDVPGGAAIGGVYAIILGMGLLITERGFLLRAITISGMIAGLFCIFICQGRTNLVAVIVASVTFIGVMVTRGSFAHIRRLVIVLSVVGFVGTSVAFSLGGQSTADRFYSLVADDPQTVFYGNRGKFLDSMVSDDGERYAIGAGMGRWGMMNSYFGGITSPLWAEMMWQALLYDGGWAAIVLYVCVLVTITRVAWRVAMRARSDRLACWAGVICGYNTAAIAASFVFPIFSISLGMEVMLLNAALYAASLDEPRIRPTSTPAVA